MTAITDTLSRVRSQLHGVTGTETKFTAFCLEHDDRNERSLSVSLSDKGNILVKCFAGCETARIVERLGLKMSDLFADPPRGEGVSHTPATLQHCNSHTAHQRRHRNAGTSLRSTRPRNGSTSTF